MRRLVRAGLLLAIAALPAPGAAARGEELDLSLLGGVRARYDLDNSDESVSGTSWGGLIEYLPTERTGIGLCVLQSDYDLPEQPKVYFLEHRSVSATEFSLTLRGYLAPGARVVPYVLWGLSAYRVLEESMYYSYPYTGQLVTSERTANQFGLHSGIGCAVPLGKYVRLGFEGQIHFIASEGLEVGEFAGLMRLTAPLLRSR